MIKKIDVGLWCGHYIMSALILFLVLLCMVPASATITPDFIMKNQAGMVQGGDVEPLEGYFPAGDFITFSDNSIVNSETVLSYNWILSDSEGSEIASQTGGNIFPSDGSFKLDQGTYLVTQRVIGSESNNPPPEIIGTVHMENYLGISGNFTYSTNYESIVPNLSLIDQSQSDNGLITNWYWAVDSSKFATIQSPFFNIGNGTHIVNLTVVDDKGNKNSISKGIVIDNARPVALPEAKIGSYFIEDGTSRTMRFVDESSGSMNRVWSFGDDTTGYDKDMVHTYVNYDNYQVTLSVSNNAGTSTTSQYVSLPDPSESIEAGFTYSQTGVRTIQFIGASSGPVHSWELDVGDGTVYTNENGWPVYHTYEAFGNFPVIMTVKNRYYEDYESQRVFVS
jgi:PKD repeat protein